MYVACAPNSLDTFLFQQPEQFFAFSALSTPFLLTGEKHIEVRAVISLV